MTQDYLSFWKNVLSELLGADKQSDKMNSMLDKTFSPFVGITSKLHKYPEGGLFTTPFDSIDNSFYKHYQKMYLGMFGFVSIDEYKDLLNQFDALKRQKKIKKSDTTTQNKLKKSASTESEETLNKTKRDLSKAKEEIKLLRKEVSTYKKQISSLEKHISTAKKIPTPAPKKNN